MHKFSLLTPLMLGAIWFAAGGAGQPPVTPPPADGASETVEMGEDRAKRMTVPVSIGNKGPYHFVVDTGSERTVISRELAGELGLAAGPVARLHSMTGEDDVSTVIIPQLGVNRDRMHDVRAPALSRADLGAVGMLGIDSLRKNRVLLDFRRQTMTIVPSETPLGRRDPDEIVVTAKSRFGQLILTNAEANGHIVNAIVDTGSQITIGNMALKRKLMRGSLHGKPKTIELIGVTGETMMAEYMFVSKIKIGGVTLTNLPIAFAEVHPFEKLELTRKPALMLGMNALKAFDRVSVDFANRKIRFLLPEGGRRDDEVMLAMRIQGRPGS
ncbi:retroviral-like aspartic protease family protein [Sphingomonas sp. LaA6.9]|uniref:retroviral-like aspartic protease family protein n=1 Tax=Sphingomonas sp. LaA6.9 TaxID=2919914 RepID=UPI001F4F39E1|nr:retroviral-like aspartic protease family protein [Sphingomonas sp. LaA6.9]MCJ8157278.1 retroviral-like aspartic protease family protein [Sphingomonas sp. LaA6.9]